MNNEKPEITDFAVNRFSPVEARKHLIEGNGAVDVTQIFSTRYAFAALRADGSVVTWGSEWYGGDSSAVAQQFSKLGA